jgi:hypothetical protein
MRSRRRKAPAKAVPTKSRKVLRKKTKAKQPFAGDKFPAAMVGDANDDRLVAGHLRALQREVRAGFELLGNKLLAAMERMDHRQDAFADELVDLRRRVTVLEASR